MERMTETVERTQVYETEDGVIITVCSYQESGTDISICIKDGDNRHSLIMSPREAEKLRDMLSKSIQDTI